VTGFAQYKGRRYRVLGTAASKFEGAGERIHLQFMDQSKDFWTDVARVDRVEEGGTAPFRPTGPPPNRAEVDAAHARRDADAKRDAERAAAQARAGLHGNAAVVAQKEADAQREARAEAERGRADAERAADEARAAAEEAKAATTAAYAEIADARAQAEAARAEALAIRNEMAGLRANLKDAHGPAATLKLAGAALDTKTIQNLAANLLDALTKAGVV
jgi:hypothetical protein